MASWCLALLLLMVGWWMMGWVTLRLQTEIPFSTLFIWIVATALLYLAAFVLVLLVGLTQETFAVTDQVALTTGIPTLLPPATLAGLSAVGAALNSERDRAFHLLAWLAVLALVIGQSALTIG